MIAVCGSECPTGCLNSGGHRAQSAKVPTIPASPQRQITRATGQRHSPRQSERRCYQKPPLPPLSDAAPSSPGAWIGCGERSPRSEAARTMPRHRRLGARAPPWRRRARHLLYVPPHHHPLGRHQSWVTTLRPAQFPRARPRQQDFTAVQVSGASSEGNWQQWQGGPRRAP